MMNTEWSDILNSRKKLSNGDWKSCPNDMYELSVHVLNAHQKANKKNIYDELYKFIGILDIMNIICSYDDTSDISDGNIHYNTMDEKIYHDRVLSQLKSWNSTTNIMYSQLFINDLEHLTDHTSKIHMIDNSLDIGLVDGYIIKVDSFFEDSDCLYLRTYEMELGRIIGTGIINDDQQSMLLIVGYRTSDHRYERIYKVNKRELENNTSKNIQMNILSNTSWNEIHKLLEYIGTFYCN